MSKQYCCALCASVSCSTLNDTNRKAVTAAASCHRQRAAPSRSGAFSGAARTLGGAGASAPPAAAPAAEDAEPAAPEPVVHTITFYENGIFTVDDGERAASAPAWML